jgi:spoIIIJ-associated protein
MLNQENLETIKKEVKDFFEKMTFKVEIEVLPEVAQTLPINIKTEEPRILIGERGETLSEIQHLLKLILKRKIKAEKPEEPFFIDLDINDYKKKKIDYLKEIAKNAAEEVLMTKKEKELPPMSSYERRIVHLELAQRTDIVSESVGEEPERRIVIKPHY